MREPDLKAQSYDIITGIVKSNRNQIYTSIIFTVINPSVHKIRQHRESFLFLFCSNLIVENKNKTIISKTILN